MGMTLGGTRGWIAWALSWGVLASGGEVWAGANGSCPKMGAVTVSRSFPQPRYIHSSSTKEIKRHSAMANMERAVVFGHTALQPYFEFRGETLTQRDGLGESCTVMGNIHVRMGYREPTVHIASEYAEGGCEYQAILDHEERHVRVARDVTALFEPKMRLTLEKEMARLGPMKNMGSQGEAHLKNQFNAVMTRLMKDYSALIDAGNERVDSDAAKRSDFSRCKAWGVKLK